MADANFIDAFPAGLRRLALNTDLTKNDLRVFQSDGIVVDDKNAHLLRNQVGFLNLMFSVRLAQRDGYRECGAFPFFADNIDIAVHELYDAFRDRHAQTGGAVFAG